MTTCSTTHTERGSATRTATDSIPAPTSRTARAARALTSMFALVTLVGAVPTLLVAASNARFASANPLAGVRPPWHWSTRDLGTSATRPLSDETVVDLLVRAGLAAAWIAVVVVVVTTVAETIHVARHRDFALPDLRGLGWAQRVGRFIAAGLIVIGPLTSARSGGAVPQLVAARPPVSVMASLPDSGEWTTPPAWRDDGEGVTHHRLLIATDRRQATREGARGDEAARRDGDPVGNDHIVVRGESVYSIAEDIAGGDAAETVEIADAILDANLGTTMPDGQRFTNPAYIEPGWVLVIPPPHADTARTPAPDEPASDEQTGGHRHVVEPGDTLSAIAAGRLGDPDEWPLIWNENAGATMVDGRTFDDPNLILPGWQLDVPAPTGVRESAGGTPGSAPDAPATPPAPSDPSPTTLPPPSPDEVPVPPVALDPDADLIAEPTPPATVAPGSSVDDDRAAPAVAASTAPATIEPSTIETSAVDSSAGAPVPADRSATVEPSTLESSADVPVPAVATTRGGPSTAGTTTTTTVASPAPTASGGDAERPVLGRSIPLRIEHAAFLAAGILTLVAIRRRHRLRAAPPRTRVPEPRAAVAETERKLRTIDPGRRTERVDVALRAIAAGLLSTDVRIGLVAVAPDGDIEVRLTAEADLPAPWTGDGASWRLAADVPIELLAGAARRVGAPCVALAQIGVAADEAELLIDLEACGLLTVEADGTVGDEIVTAVAAGLGASIHAEVAHLITVSLPDRATLGHRNSHRADSLDAALELAAGLVGSTLASDETTFALRSRQTGGEVWEPAVVLLGSGDDNTDGDAQLDVPGVGHGLAVMAATGRRRSEAENRLVACAGGWVLEAFGCATELTPIGVPPDDLDMVNALLDDATSPLDAETGPTRTATGGPPVAVPDDAEPVDPGPFVPSEHEIIVSLMGPVGVADRAGTAGRFERSKTVELIAWLATHRAVSTRAAARSALWELDVRDATFANVVSEARRGLARLVTPPDDGEWLERTLTEQLPLHPAVVTDAQLIEERLRAATLQPPSLAIETLRPAAEMIRDLPFSGTEYLWPDAEGLTSNLVLLATSVTTELAAHGLATDDIELVFWATARGLAVLPGHEESIGLRMQAHAGAGDLSGVRQEWETYERVVIADPWSDGEPAPKLLALRRELLEARR